jgi:CRP-like cAMP-binding protein
MSASDLRTIRVLAKLSDAQLEQLFSYGEFLEFAAGQQIIKQGDEADGIYFLIQGKVASYFTDKNGAQTPLVTSEEGSHFGELALLQHGIRTASVRASTKVRVFRIGLESFESILNAPEIATPLLYSLAKSMAFRMTSVTERLADAKSLKNAWL